ncbi:hypothetical protein BaRGS_00029184, partial [Batillaria attramentaria]
MWRLRILFALCLIFQAPVYTNSVCPGLPPVRNGDCFAADLASDTTVFPLSEGNCNFTGSLCSYHQACRDPGMSNWTAGIDAAEVYHESGCSESYSVLESRWLELQYELCVTFKFSADPPASLTVVMESTYSFPDLCNERSTLVSGGDVVTQTVRVPNPVTGQLRFRARGGGDESLVKIYYVNVEAGRCEKPETSKIDAVDRDVAIIMGSLLVAVIVFCAAVLLAVRMGRRSNKITDVESGVKGKRSSLSGE